MNLQSMVSEFDKKMESLKVNRELNMDLLVMGLEDINLLLDTLKTKRAEEQEEDMEVQKILANGLLSFKSRIQKLEKDTEQLKTMMAG